MAKLTLEALTAAGFDAETAARIMALAEEPDTPVVGTQEDPEEPETPDTGTQENPEEPETPDTGTQEDPEEPETPDNGTQEDPEEPETPDTGTQENPEEPETPDNGTQAMAAENRELRNRLTDMQLRLAATKAGIHPNRLDIVRRIADLDGFDAMADDANAQMDSVVSKILELVPELASNVSTGTLGGTVRKHMTNDPFSRGFGK